jgi:hypothetical protein
VDAFHGARQWKRSSGCSPTAFGGRKTKNRAQPFATRENRITHRFVDRRRRCFFLGQKPIQRAIDQALAGFQVGGQVHDAKNKDRINRIIQDYKGTRLSVIPLMLLKESQVDPIKKENS